jgi:CRP/FNR family transcriptional regulator, cyclic AMP receptor protein
MSSEIMNVPPGERVLALRASPEFDALSPTELWRMAGCLRLRHIEAGEVLAIEGLPRSTLELVVSGRVEVLGPAGRKTLGPRDVIGSFAELLDETPSPRVVAITRTAVLAFDRSDVEDLIEDDFSIFLGVLRGMARSLVQRGAQREAPVAVAATGAGVGSERASALSDGILVLKAVPYFARAELAALAALVEGADQVSLAVGSSLFTGQAAPERFLVVTSGCVSVDAALDSFRAGDALALVESVAVEPIGFTAVAQSPVRAVSIPTSLLLDLVEDYPGLGLGLLRAFARRAGRPAPDGARPAPDRDKA